MEKATQTEEAQKTVATEGVWISSLEQAGTIIKTLMTFGVSTAELIGKTEESLLDLATTIEEALKDHPKQAEIMASLAVVGITLAMVAGKTPELMKNIILKHGTPATKEDFEKAKEEGSTVCGNC